ncbi:MAG: NADH-quinone oxidoreductase subunit J, partial [Myxococcales bacterium]
MNPAELLFWVIAGLTVGSAAGVAFSRSIINSSLSLLGALLGVGGLYVFLSADFLAVAQILIYVGGVLVLILFAVMLTSRIQDARASNAPAGGVAAAVCTLLLALVVVLVAVLGPFRKGQEQAAGATASA